MAKSCTKDALKACLRRAGSRRAKGKCLGAYSKCRAASGQPLGGGRRRRRRRRR